MRVSYLEVSRADAQEAVGGLDQKLRREGGTRDGGLAVVCVVVVFSASRCGESKCAEGNTRWAAAL